MSEKSPFCCQDMAIHVKETKIIYYSEIFDEYGIVFCEDENSYQEINFCPWCGKHLPLSKRDEWFNQLETLGFDCPLFDDSIPNEYKSSAWWSL